MPDDYEASDPGHIKNANNPLWSLFFLKAHAKLMSKINAFRTSLHLFCTSVFWILLHDQYPRRSQDKNVNKQTC